MNEKKCTECVVDEPFSECEDDPCTYIRPKIPLLASTITESSKHNTDTSSNSTNNINELINLNEDVVDKLFGEDRLATLNSLLSDGTDINRLGINNERLINWACKNGYPVLVKLLLENGANPNLFSSSKEKAIFYAISSDCTHVVDLIVEYGFNQNMNMLEELDNYLYEAIEAQKPEMVKHLLHWGIDPNICSYLLVVSSYFDANVTIFKLLLSHGITMESATRGPYTLAWSILDNYAEEVSKEQFDIFVLLLEREGLERCEEYEYSKSGCSLLHFAIAPHRLDHLEHLLKLGLDPNSREKRYWLTPLHYAVSENNMRGYQLLLSYGAIAEPGDCDGNTPLHIAISEYNYESVKNLLLFDVRSGAVNSDGKTAMDIALDHDDKEIIEWLLLFGVKVCEIEKFITDVSKHQKIRSKLMHYVIKKRTAGMREDLNVAMNERMYYLENRYQKQLDKMKDLKILDSEYNCLDLLRANKRVLVEIASKWSENEIKKFYLESIRGKFPAYQKFLRRNLYVAIRHVPVYNKAIDSFHDLIGSKLPSAVIEEIMAYLNVSQMENIIKSGQ